MTESVANTLWATSLTDELARAGVREVVIAPGSRSTPLVMAFAADDRFHMRVHLDERSAAFFALGAGKASGRPAVVVTTSGTAVANVFPAVVEASQSGVPLLVLTADRPHRLRDADANQAIDQIGIYGGFARAFFEMAPPTVDAAALKHLRVVAARAVGIASGPDAGPVHMNFPFDKPLEPVDLSGVEAAALTAASGRSHGTPFVDLISGRPALSQGQLEALAALFDAGRGVIVAGPTEGADRVGPAVVGLAAATGYPVLADPLSGARYGPPGGAQIVSTYDFFLRDEGVRSSLAPELIVRLGASPTSAALQQWLLQNDGVRHVVIDGSGRWMDHGAMVTHYVHADAAETLIRLTALVANRGEAPGDLTSWSEAWDTAESVARSAIVAAVGEDQGVHEGEILASVVESMPADGALVVSSSMPIRDLDAFGHARAAPLHVFANRGASGIDGIVSTAFGVASQRGAPTVCVIGDVAFFHDQNGLLWAREQDAPVVFVLIDNDGGGIFHMLPIADHDPDFTRFFATPHGVDPKYSAAAHGLDFEVVGPADVGPALARSISERRTAILCVRTNREVNHRRHVEVQKSVAEAVRQALAARITTTTLQHAER